MNFSIDSNVVIGVVNYKDRLHEKSISLMKDKQNEKLFICLTVLKESQTVFRNKINQVIVEIIQFLPFFKTNKFSSMDFQAKMIENFREMKSKKPELTNFLDFIYDEIQVFLKDNKIDKLPSFLSTVSIKYSKYLPQKINQIHSNSEVLILDKKQLDIVKKATIEIHFKDTNDERIFQELMTNLCLIKPIDFYLDDAEFAKKIDEAYLNLDETLGFENDAFSCNLLKDL
jgi:hypothetical protein